MTANPQHDQISALLRVIDIPACPAVLIDLDTELRKEEPDQRVIARIISRDVALSGQVMQVANSPSFSTGRPMDSVSRALTVLGMRQMFNLVVTQLLKVAIAGQGDVSMDRFWDNSATAARVSAELARRLGSVKPEMAYTFGLFHDCGIPLLMKRFPNYREVLGEANASPDRLFTEVEEERLGTSHAVVGYYLARRWRLPEFAVQGILLHHDYSVLDGNERIPADSLAVIAINVLSEHIIRLHARLGTENEWIKAEARVRTFLGLAGDECADLIDDMLDWLESQRQQASV